MWPCSYGWRRMDTGICFFGSCCLESRPGFAMMMMMLLLLLLLLLLKGVLHGSQVASGRVLVLSKGSGTGPVAGPAGRTGDRGMMMAGW